MAEPLVTHGSPSPAVFYYDLGSPACYLVAEQILAGLPVVAEWEPVLASQIGGADDGLVRAQFEHAAARAGLQPVRWPREWPPRTRTAMLAARYAKSIGRAVAFSLAAFRQAFAAGRELGDEATVLLAGAACEMHPAALLKGISLRSVEQSLERAGQRALASGVRSLPAIAVADEVFEGADAIERAALAIGG